MLSIAATPSGDGILTIPGTTGTAAFAHAALNIATAGTVTLTPTDTPVGQAARGLPVTLTICQTNLSGTCINPATPAPSATVNVTNNQIVTFSIFAQGQGQNIAFDPANSRIFVIAKQGTTAVGEASVAVRTQ